VRYADGIARIVMGRPTIRTEAASGAVIHTGRRTADPSAARMIRWRAPAMLGDTDNQDCPVCKWMERISSRHLEWRTPGTMNSLSSSPPAVPPTLGA